MQLRRPPAPRKLDLFTADGRLRTLDDIEQDVMRFALFHCGGSMTAAASALGVARSTAYRKLGETARLMARLKKW